MPFLMKNGGMLRSKLSQKTILKIKLHELPQYALAQRAEISPDLLSKWINGQKEPRSNDPRLERLAQVLGFTTEEILRGDL